MMIVVAVVERYGNAGDAMGDQLIGGDIGFRAEFGGDDAVVLGEGGSEGAEHAVGQGGEGGDAGELASGGEPRDIVGVDQGALLGAG